MDPVVSINNEQTILNNKNVLVHEIHENFASKIEKIASILCAG